MADITNDLSLKSPAQDVAGDVSGLLDDIVSALLISDPYRFFAISDIPVGGTNYAIVGARFLSNKFRDECAAAMRANGFKIS